MRFIRAVLQLQDRIAPPANEEAKRASAGRKGRLIIDGEDGGIIYLRWNGKHLVEELDDSDVRNDFCMHAQTFQDLMTGELGAREALAAQLIQVTGDRSIYDEEDIMKMFEFLQRRMARLLRRQEVAPR